MVFHVPTNRLQPKANEYLGVGVMKAIVLMKLLSKRCINHDQEVYVCFVDCEKAFDRVER